MEASPEQSAEGLAIVRVLSAVLDRLVCANAPIARADPGAITKFQAMKAPGISMLQYLERIHKFACCSNECFIIALIYIDRLIQRNNFFLTDLNVHRVVITSVLLAAKFFDDAYYNNAYYAKVGGVLVAEINGLEVDFLFRINFSLLVTPDEFEKYRVELLSHSVQTPILEEALYQVPVQVSPEVVPAADPIMYQHQAMHAAAPPPPHNMMPSPSYCAARMVKDPTMLAIMPPAPEFPHFHRAHSMPPLLQKHSPMQQHRSYPHSVPVQPRWVDPYNAVVTMESSSQGICPLQAALVHHHHGSFSQGSADSTVVHNRMLAGGVGL